MHANHRPPRRASTPPAILLSLAAALVSLHRSKASAWRAMHRAQWAAWEALQAEQRTPRRWRDGFWSVRGRKVYEHERSFVRAVEVLP